MADKLLPCPFCGGEAEILTAESMNGGYLFGIMCNDCRSRGDVYDTEAEAVDAWNTRSAGTCKSMTDDNAWCFMCSECGKSFPRSKLRYAHNHGEINYCPNCGAKVVER